jgi:hypothetical protein
VAEAVRRRCSLTGISDLAHCVAVIVSDRRPEPGARYRLYEIRQKEGLAIVPLDSSLFGQIRPNRTAGDILVSEINQVTGQQNLYAMSGPVSGDLSFFGREGTLQGVIDLLNSGQPVAIFGLRKVGKTSLIQRLRGRLAQERASALVDAQSIRGQMGVWPFYPAIVSGLVDHLRHTQPDLALPPLRLYPPEGVPSAAMAGAFLQDLHDLHATLESAGGEHPLLLILDEVERLLPSGRAPGLEGFETLLGQLRVANQQSRILDFVLVGVDPAINRRERWQDCDNELYLALREVWMPPMAPRDVREMIESLGSQMGVRYEEEALQLLAAVGGGQPFVTRQICALLVEGRLGEKVIRVGHDQAVEAVEDFVSDGTYLPEMWQARFDDGQREMLRTLARSAEPVPREQLLPASRRQQALAGLKRLRDCTLVRREGVGYVLAWEVLRMWIRWVELGLEE